MCLKIQMLWMFLVVLRGILKLTETLHQDKFMRGLVCLQGCILKKKLHDVNKGASDNGAQLQIGK